MSIIRTFLSLFLVILFCQVANAQEKSAYYVTVHQLKGKHITGELVAITKEGITLKSKQSKDANVQTLVLYAEIERLALKKNRKNIGLFIFGAAGIGASVAYGVSLTNTVVAAAVIVGGSLAVIALSAVIYNIANPPVLKLSRREDTIDYNTVNESLKVYINSNSTPVPANN